MRDVSIVSKEQLLTMAQRIKTIRKENGLTQEEFAERIGAVRETVGTWERAQKPIGFDFVMAICREFDCDSDYIIGRIEEKTHDAKGIHALTGLSEKAITKLMKWNKAKDRSHLWVKYLSQMIENKHFDVMMGDITKLVSSAKCWIKALKMGKQSYMEEEKESYNSSLYALNKDIAEIADTIAKQEIGG